MTKIASWQKTRKFFNDIHLWLGLASGIVLLLVCFSGTLYTFNTELNEWASSDLYHVAVPDQARVNTEVLIKNLTAKTEGTLSSIYIPIEKDRSYQFGFLNQTEKGRKNIIYFVNPYNAKVLGTSEKKTGMRKFMGYMFSMHRWLLLDKIEKPIFGSLANRKLGSYITGTATILFTIGVLTGLVIWFPPKLRSWKQGLKIKWGGSWKRTNHDLHNTLGLYAIVFLFLMGVTGPFFSFDWYRTGLRKVLGTHKEAKTAVKKEETISSTPTQLLSMESYMAMANKVLNYEGDYKIYLPKQGEKSIELQKNKNGFFAPIAADKVVLNTENRSIESVSIFKEKPINERISGSIKALHMGNIYGMFSKILYFISCLIATTLPVTGTLIWLNKMKKKKPIIKKIRN